MSRLGRIFTVLGLLMGLAPVAHASYTRSQTLGDGGRYIMDETNVRMFPSLIAEFPDQFGLEIGKQNADSQAFVGAMDPVMAEVCGHLHINTVYGIVLGIWASDYNDEFASTFAQKFDLAAGKIGYDPKGAAANREYDILLGRAFSWGNVGLQIFAGSANYKRSPNSNPTETSVFDPKWDRTSDSSKISELGLRLGGTLKLNRITVDAAFTYGSHSFKFRPDGFNFPGSLSGAGDVGFLARANWILSARWAIVPLFNFTTTKISGTQTINSGNGSDLKDEQKTGHTLNMQHLELGVGVVLTPSPGVTVYVAPAIQYDKKHTKDWTYDDYTTNTTSVLNLPVIRSGIEFRLTDWLVMRSAFVKYVPTESVSTLHYIWDDGKGNSTYSGSNEKYDVVPKNGTAVATNPWTSATKDYYYTMGFGVNYNKFFLDFELDPEFLNSRGPNFLSGDTGPMFLRASATYLF